MCDDLIGTVNQASTPLHQPESVSQGQSKQSQGDDWEGEKAEKQTSIRGGFQRVSRGGPSTVASGDRSSGVPCNSA